jgi:pimeloyl-ACP methyl ester carboxylesterase
VSEPQSYFVSYFLDQAFRRMAVHGWGDPSAPVVVCVHGLTRNGRDFDALAQGLCDRYRVLCPDLPGRGASDWLDNGPQYQAPSYVVALAHLLATVTQPVRWVGTSLGGICGMLLAAARGAPMSHLVLNDIGPFVAQAPLLRIAGYLAETPEFADLAALEAHLRHIHAPFGQLSDAQWAHLARCSARPLPGGRVALNYDPKMIEPMVQSRPEPIDLWSFYRAITAKLMVIRGESSDLLSTELFEEMCRLGATGLLVAEAGHAPALMEPDQIDAVRRFLA